MTPGATQAAMDAPAAPSPWRSRRPLGTVLGIVLVLVVLTLTALSVLFISENNANDSRALLELETRAAASTEEADIGSITPVLDSLATSATLSGDAPSAFDRQCAIFAGAPVGCVLAQREGQRFVVIAGTGRAVGSTVDPRDFSTLAAAGAHYVVTPVFHRGPDSAFALAVGPPAVPAGHVVLLEVQLPTYTRATSDSGGAFSSLDLAFYDGRGRGPAQLIETSANRLPLTGQLATVSLPIGTTRWTLVSAVRRPLIGTVARLAPWIVLMVGVLLAGLIAFVVSVLSRRERYASAVAGQRTAELRESQRAQVRSERLAAMGQMATVIGHELRNPLGAVINTLYLARAALEDGDLTDAGRQLAVAEREAGRSAALAEDLTAYMRERDPVVTRLALSDAIDEALEVAPPPPGIDVARQGTGIVLDADPSQLHQILMNLLTNAYQAIAGEGTVTVVAEDYHDAVAISVEDSGVGFAPEPAERAFEPFFTTKPSGTGLGLAIVQRLVEAHHGSVSISNRPTGGARITLRFPKISAPFACAPSDLGCTLRVPPVPRSCQCAVAGAPRRWGFAPSGALRLAGHRR